MSGSNVHDLSHRFGHHVRPASSASGDVRVETLPEDTRLAFGYMIQLYGMMAGAGLYCDYQANIDEQRVHMTMRRFRTKSREDAEWHWMSFDHNPETKHWSFYYRGISLSDTDLHTLTLKAQRSIGAFEKREFPPVLHIPPALRAPALLA